jgi:hypothetical protein
MLQALMLGVTRSDGSPIPIKNHPPQVQNSTHQSAAPHLYAYFPGKPNARLQKILFADAARDVLIALRWISHRAKIQASRTSLRLRAEPNRKWENIFSSVPGTRRHRRRQVACIAKRRSHLCRRRLGETAQRHSVNSNAVKKRFSDALRIPSTFDESGWFTFAS